MTGFWIAGTLATVLVLALLFRPFWLKASATGVSRRQLNAAIYREQMARLERDRAENMIAEADYVQARAELQRRVIDDTHEADDTASIRAPKKTMWAVGLALPIAAIFKPVALLIDPPIAPPTIPHSAPKPRTLAIVVDAHAP